jgi:hypothetical protein
VGEFMHSQATIEWSMTEAGFSFVSDAAKTSTSDQAVIGRERNGKFFS